MTFFSRWDRIQRYFFQKFPFSTFYYLSVFRRAACFYQKWNVTNLLIEGAALLLLRILSLRLVNDTSVLPALIYIQVFHPNEAQVWPLSKPEIFPSFFLYNLFSLYTVTVSKILVIICLSREDFSKKNRHSSQFYILLALLVSLGQVTLWPVGVLTSPYIFWGQENKENDHQLKKLMIV